MANTLPGGTRNLATLPSQESSTLKHSSGLSSPVVRQMQIPPGQWALHPVWARRQLEAEDLQAAAPAVRHSNPITEELSEATAQFIISQKDSLSRVPLRRREQTEAWTREILAPPAVSDFCSDIDGLWHEHWSYKMCFTNCCFYETAKDESKYQVMSVHDLPRRALQTDTLRLRFRERVSSWRLSLPFEFDD